MQRSCDCCGEAYEASRPNSRFKDATHRKAFSRGKRPRTTPPSTQAIDQPPPPKPNVGAKLAAEFEALGVAGTYEAGMALWLAGQLDTGEITGTAGVSMSKELDRRVDLIRLKAERPDDPVAKIRSDLQEHQLRLVEGGAG